MRFDFFLFAVVKVIEKAQLVSSHTVALSQLESTTIAQQQDFDHLASLLHHQVADARGVIASLHAWFDSTFSIPRRVSFI
jgi:hypothetical protein